MWKRLFERRGNDPGGNDDRLRDTAFLRDPKDPQGVVKTVGRGQENPDEGHVSTPRKSGKSCRRVLGSSPEKNNERSPVQRSSLFSPSSSAKRRRLTGVKKDSTQTEEPIQEEAENVPPAGHAVINSETCVSGERCKVVDVFDFDYETKILHVNSASGGSEIVVWLMGVWAETDIRKDDTVNLFGTLKSDGTQKTMAIDASEGLLVLNPDMQISGTRVASSVHCLRKAVLSELVESREGNEAALKGNLLHEILQAALRHKVVNEQDLLKEGRKLVSKFGDLLYELDMTEDTAMKEIEKNVPLISQWMQTYVGHSVPKTKAVVEPHLGGFGTNIGPVSITQVIDIEDIVEAPEYGLKGRIDATVQARTRQQGKILPFEFKTGRPNVTDTAQVSLYLLLLESKYDCEIPAGLLWHLRNGVSMTSVERKHGEIAALMRNRNAIVARLRPNALTLPPPLDDEWPCGKCFQRKNCAAFHKVIEGGNVQTAGGVATVFSETAANLNPQHEDFLKKWLAAVELEDAEVKRNKEYVASVFKQMRANLLDLIMSTSSHYEQLRKLIIDLDPPKFSQPDQTTREVLRNCAGTLNFDQRSAVQKVLCTSDYSLIWGMPGTGKTTTMAAAVKALTEVGKCVLISSYTNSAVDTLLCKLIEIGVDFIRVGNASKVHEDVKHHVLGGAKYPDTSVKGVHKVMQSVKVVGVTCLGLKHPLLTRWHFDVSIIDEAGQITTPSILGPLMKSDAFVLVGDPNQLPPLVVSKEAQDNGLGESLFQTLSSRHQQAQAVLGIQYRMCEDIMKLANKLVYEGKLVRGSEAVANRKLEYPKICPEVVERHPDWILEALLREDRGVCFLDTDGMGHLETSSDNRKVNQTEVDVASKLASALIELGVEPRDIGIISPYKAQIALLRECIEGVEVGTVDTYQGRDKLCVIVSFVRSNTEGESGVLLSDWRRVNVAITRAKAKLIMIGSRSTLKNNEFLGKLLSLVDTILVSELA